jgi:hypothetical protein
MTQHPHHTANTTGNTTDPTTSGPQLPPFLPTSRTSRTIRTLRLTRNGKPRRRRPWHQLPVFGCIKVVDVLLLGLLLTLGAYVTHDLRSTGRQPTPATYANGLGTGP